MLYHEYYTQYTNIIFPSVKLTCIVISIVCILYIVLCVFLCFCMCVVCGRQQQQQQQQQSNHPSYKDRYIFVLRFSAPSVCLHFITIYSMYNF